MKFISASELAEKDFITVDVLLGNGLSRRKKINVLVFRFQGRVYAYHNHCMHMHRPLNCEADAVFDQAGIHLRCSMHGFLFTPETGACISPVCLGQTLPALKIIEQEGMLIFTQKHLQILKIVSRPVINSQEGL